jgi:hypothetical protein
MDYIDKEKVKQNITLILDALNIGTDPQMLNEYRSILKKEIPFFRRSWAAAYMLMHFDQQNIPGISRQSKHRSSNDKAGQNKARQYPLADEDSRRIFISIGRNRRVFPREILGLVISKTGVSRDDIGAIRILESYSFVQVRDSVADKIIETLNGHVFRGRKLAVNYAKNRNDDNPDAGNDCIDSEHDQD